MSDDAREAIRKSLKDGEPHRIDWSEDAEEYLGPISIYSKPLGNSILYVGETGAGAEWRVEVVIFK